MGFMLGLLGYLAALVAFGYIGLFTGGADAADQLAAGMAAAYIVALIASAATLVAAVRVRRSRPRTMVGLLVGMTIGVVLVAVLSVRISDLMNDVGGTCPCEPLIDQVRSSQG